MSTSHGARDAALVARMHTAGRPLIWTCIYLVQRPTPPALVDHLEVFRSGGKTKLGVVGTFLPQEGPFFQGDCARSFVLPGRVYWRPAGRDELGIDFRSECHTHHFTRRFDQLSNQRRVAQWLAYIATAAGQAALADVVAHELPADRTVLARSAEWPEPDLRHCAAEAFERDPNRATDPCGSMFLGTLEQQHIATCYGLTVDELSDIGRGLFMAWRRIGVLFLRHHGTPTVPTIIAIEQAMRAAREHGGQCEPGSLTFIEQADPFHCLDVARASGYFKTDTVGKP